MADPRRAGSTPTTVPPPPPPPPPPSNLTPAPSPTTTDGVAASGADSVGAAESPGNGGYKLRFCTVCASNQNR